MIRSDPKDPNSRMMHFRMWPKEDLVNGTPSEYLAEYGDAYFSDDWEYSYLPEHILLEKYEWDIINGTSHHPHTNSGLATRTSLAAHIARVRNCSRGLD